MSEPTLQKVLGLNSSSRLALAGTGLVMAAGLACLSLRTEPVKLIDSRLVVDPNRVPPGVLMALPRLGPGLVARIVAQREIQPFESLDDLDRRVKGIGPATMRSIRPYLNIEDSNEIASRSTRNSLLPKFEE